jgi:hypothetical protein
MTSAPVKEMTGMEELLRMMRDQIRQAEENAKKTKKAKKSRNAKKTRTTKTKKVRKCASRKGIKAGPHRKIVINEVFGLLTVTGRAPNDRKHRQAHTICKCGKRGTCRFDELYGGIVKSCGHRRDETFVEIFGGLARALSRSKKTTIFTDIVSGMSDLDISLKYHIQSYVVGFVRRQEYGRLERLRLSSGKGST